MQTNSSYAPSSEALQHRYHLSNLCDSSVTVELRQKVYCLVDLLYNQVVQDRLSLPAQITGMCHHS